MKSIYYIMLVSMILAFSCTSDFDEINQEPGVLHPEEAASGRYYLTNPEYKLFAPDRFPYWRGPLLHGDRYAGHFTTGFDGCWWTGELGYSYDAAYTDATWDWLAGYVRYIDEYLDLTVKGGVLENEKMYAVGLILRGLYYQKYSDIFGEVPYSEAGVVDILSPKFDTHREIYAGVIQELNTAMEIIGDATTTGEALQDLGENDLYYGGDLQKWKKLANTLKLRMALRALGAEGADFADAAIKEALNNPLVELPEESALLKKDNVIDQFTSAVYGDVWHNFGLGSNWTVSKHLIDFLRDNGDPRLQKYAAPAIGGVCLMPKPSSAAEQKAVDLMLSNLDDAGVIYTRKDTTVSGESKINIRMASNTYYVGQPARLNITSFYFANYNFFSIPSERIIMPKNSGDIFPEIILAAGEAYFLRAEAAVRGYGGDANALFQEGIRQSMLLWEVEDAAISDYIANSAMATLTGTDEEMLEKINTQRWVADYTDGFEAWAVVRKSGYPTHVAAGVDDPEIYGFGELNGAYPQRMRYGSNEVSTNGNNLQEALSRQGADLQSTTLWWAK
ncbi:SusD/RagB family nutrient-binding outer membrane lipoprotein [Fulvivirga sediminis]|uniref:SusD/RagB family nutrient-binding outer membrane lipoprotein n=1 Tax=Fulvivirga sediminis TaxID=2803949 RepID=A0A937K0U2_9BACT|nr:SusD/RagB family nutrient-binding outer membrane lipoprotein [Fulvivirga sediminis]MBL3656726.1 SusD/RagB family nutrient-binding outer membrane lipoprotein [Fulvivirga sediminis]